ncbi:hypothetical protein [Paenibacillus sanguinis]|uniref:hypothetical protein n=1 Tax=Paenibacillus sanguinis TaxID=225906 RepID=UPI00036F914E|nr:hypothetical protein [Paenibacillus sanguinis]
MIDAAFFMKFSGKGSLELLEMPFLICHSCRTGSAFTEEQQPVLIIGAKNVIGQAA